jgi:hypothetical protein
VNLREFDRLIATEVLDWEYHSAVYTWGELFSPTKYVTKEGKEVLPYDLPNFSTNIADAWVILDEFDDYELCGTPFKNEYYAKLKKDGKWFSAESSVSQEHAICLAALKAVGVEESE